MRPGKTPRYHYRVIDIKFTTLYLRADGVKLLNSGSIPAWKGQLWIYNQALGRIQGHVPPHAYILGRKWMYTSKGETYRGNSCVDRLGVVDFVDVDGDTSVKTKEALKWIREMRTKGHLWDVLSLPLKRKELYPNMSNGHDYPWRPVKEMIANDIKEITNLWMCGVKNRTKAHTARVYQWTDPRCTTEVLGVNGLKTRKILDEIISINRNDDEDVKVLPKLIIYNDKGWQRRQLVEFYVDFEFMNDVMSESSNMPIVETSSVIFLIGVGYFDPFTHEWIYKPFIVDTITEKEERRICAEFSDYIRKESEWWECENPLMVHWSPAEKWQWASAIDRHKTLSEGDPEKVWIPAMEKEGANPRWFDLLQVFKKEPVVIKGCLGFSLKEVAKALAEHNLIKTTWNQDGFTNGTSAMLATFKASKDAASRNLKLKDMPQIQDVIKYNEVDCKVVGEIIKYLREHHGREDARFGEKTVAQIVS